MNKNLFFVSTVNTSYKNTEQVFLILQCLNFVPICLINYIADNFNDKKADS